MPHSEGDIMSSDITTISVKQGLRIEFSNFERKQMNGEAL